MPDRHKQNTGQFISFENVEVNNANATNVDVPPGANMVRMSPDGSGDDLIFRTDGTDVTPGDNTSGVPVGNSDVGGLLELQLFNNTPTISMTTGGSSIRVGMEFLYVKSNVGG